jgi:hypothetical protein
MNLSKNLDINEIMKHYFISAVWKEEEQMAEMEEQEISNFYGDSEEITKLVPRNEISVDRLSDDAKIRAYEDIKKFLSIEGVKEAIEKRKYRQ